MMKKVELFVLTGIICCWLINACNAQSSSQDQSLQLISTIPMPTVGGRIDHLAYDSIHQLVFVAALGNNTVEVADMRTGKIIHTIIELDEPQGIAVIPESNSLFVANGGEGECDVYNTATFQKTASVKLEDDADNVRYDPVGKKIYVGYGSGGIAVIDAVTFKLITEVKLPAHPESFQLDNTSGRIYVNVPDEQKVVVMDMGSNSVVSQWNIADARRNFPMALDEKGHRLFVGCRDPATLLIMDTRTGNVLSRLDIDSDADDIFYDSKSGQLFVSCGNSYLDIFRDDPEGKMEALGQIETSPGARTSLFIPERNQIVVAAPSRPGKDAHLLVYQVK